MCRIRMRTRTGFSVSTTPEDIAFERDKSIRGDLIEGKTPREYSYDYLETIAIQLKAVCILELEAAKLSCEAMSEKNL